LHQIFIGSNRLPRTTLTDGPTTPPSGCGPPRAKPKNFFSLLNSFASVIGERYPSANRAADLPVQAPTKFGLVVNLKAATGVGHHHAGTPCSLAPTRSSS